MRPVERPPGRRPPAGSNCAAIMAQSGPDEHQKTSRSRIIATASSRPERRSTSTRSGRCDHAIPTSAGLAWLIPAEGQALAPVVFISHPSRFPDTRSAPKLTFESLRGRRQPDRDRGRTRSSTSVASRPVSGRRDGGSLGSARCSDRRCLGSVAPGRVECLGRHRELGLSRRRPGRLLAVRVRIHRGKTTYIGRLIYVADSSGAITFLHLGGRSWRKIK